jgi:hypothetical protein
MRGEKKIFHRIFIVLLALGALVSFGDVLWNLFLHAGRILLEVLELVCDTLLEGLGLAPRSAQIITAWLGFIACIFIIARLVNKLIAVTKRGTTAASAWLQERTAASKGWWRTLGWQTTLAAVLGLAIIAFFFS